VRRSCVLFCVSEICESTGVQRRQASHMSPTLYRCQRLQTSSRLDVRSGLCVIFGCLCVFLCLFLSTFNVDITNMTE